jgi:hypothetical protein
MPSTLHSEKRVLVSWYIDPRYIPPFVLTNRQITVLPKASPDLQLSPYDAFTPYGRYDLYAALEAARLPTQYDAIVVWSDAVQSNQPVNLEAFDCPKVLCVGDTHHMETPIRKMLDYALDARYDFVLSSHNRQHLHWFIEAGISQVGWLPGIKVQNIAPPFTADRRPEVCFFGNAGTGHPRRMRLLTELIKRKAFPLAAMYGSRAQAADRFATSAVSLNCSLNGDLNLRVFEVLAASGCLLTDRLSPQSGLSLILEEGKEFLGYDTIEECTTQAQFLLGHPQDALNIARAGNRAFSRMTPDIRADELFEWVFSGKLDSLYRVPGYTASVGNASPSLTDRVRVYETLQAIHRVKLSPAILFMEGVPDIHIADALDLRHLRLYATGSRRQAARVSMLGSEQIAARQWDCVVTSGAPLPASVTSHQSVDCFTAAPPN